ncbi:MAG TPA: hypothetical protein VHY77_11435 [Acidimicrobiales bacterium]|nr:hypothetical protein [Acidimicrobiales bacterium]
MSDSRQPGHPQPSGIGWYCRPRPASAQGDQLSTSFGQGRLFLTLDDESGVSDHLEIR